MKKISKMYFKYEDIFKSEHNIIALEINSYIRCYVKITQIVFSKKPKFAAEVINDKEGKAEIMIFEDITAFNSYVKFQRWLND